MAWKSPQKAKTTPTGQEDEDMKNNMKELNLNEMEKVSAGENIQPTKEQMEAVGKIIEWISSWFD